MAAELNWVRNHTALSTRADLPVYLRIRDRDVVGGVLNEKTDDGLFQVWPVVLPVIVHSHGIQN